MRSSSLSSCVCECGRLLLLLLRVSLKRAFLENGPRWQETSQGGTLQVCMSQHVGSLAEEADTLIKSYLEPLLIVPSGVSSLHLITHIHAWVTHWIMCACMHYTTVHFIYHCCHYVIILCHQVLHRQIQWPRQVLLHRNHLRVTDDGALARPRGSRLAQHHHPRHGDEYVLYTCK